jgi:hypothetical protein
VPGPHPLQPAQPTTVGKRACLWLSDLLADLERLQLERSRLLLRGAKGTTGTQASFLQLLGDGGKVKELDRRIASAFGFAGTYPVTGQTSPRKPEFYMLAVLSGIAQSAHKFASDVRLLARLKELDEPAGEGQVGSSAMPYKRNPMRCERMTALARYLISLEPNAAWTAASQWLERTLDDSANRRVVLPEAFLTADALLLIWGRSPRASSPSRNGSAQPRGGAAVHGQRGDLIAAARGRPPEAAREAARALREAARRVKDGGERNPDWCRRAFGLDGRLTEQAGPAPLRGPGAGRWTSFGRTVNRGSREPPAADDEEQV